MSQLRENHGRTLIEFEFPQGGKARVKIEGSTEHFEVVSRRLGHMAQPLLQIPTTSHQLPTTSQNQHLLPPAHDFLNDQKLLSPQIQSQNQNQNQVQISDYQNPYFLPYPQTPTTHHQAPTTNTQVQNTLHHQNPQASGPSLDASYHNRIDFGNSYPEYPSAPTTIQSTLLGNLSSTPGDLQSGSLLKTLISQPSLKTSFFRFLPKKPADYFTWATNGALCLLLLMNPMTRKAFTWIPGLGSVAESTGSALFNQYTNLINLTQKPSSNPTPPLPQPSPLPKK
jgi:hypothetical protein